MSDDVRGARYVGLERAETALHGRARHATERRAALEEELALALAAGDRERVSELRAVLATVVNGTADHGVRSSSHRGTKCAAFACRALAIRAGLCEWHAARAEVERRASSGEKSRCDRA